MHDDHDEERQSALKKQRLRSPSPPLPLPPIAHTPTTIDIDDINTSSPPCSNNSSNPFKGVARQIDHDEEFARLNKDYNPPKCRRFRIPSHATDAIRGTLEKAWGNTTPRQFQIEAVFDLAYRKVPMMYLIRKTGDGKSDVFKCLASMLKGITVCMVPLIGLGSDQTFKSHNKYDGFEAYHVDEFREGNAKKLCERLVAYTRKELSSIVLFMSPLALQSDTIWFKTLSTLAKRSSISAVCIDEAHTAVTNYESFRPEFKSAIENINTLVSISKDSKPKHRVPILVMSATFTIPLQREFNNLIHRMPSVVVWGDMKRRNVGIFVNTVGNPICAFLSQWSSHIQEDPTKKSLVYCNSATVCEGSLLSRLESAHNKLPPEVKDCIGKFSLVAFTGKCGVMMKSYLMDAFSGESEDKSLPNIVCMPCTSAANCGVSSKLCTRCYRIGPPPNILDLVQEMGRVDRSHTGALGANSYHIYLNVPTYIQLWIRTQMDANAAIRSRQAEYLLLTLKHLVLPSKCLHQIIEEHFENPASREDIGPCSNNCSYCLCREWRERVSGEISKSKLINILHANIFINGSVPADKLVGMFTSDKGRHLRSNIWCGRSTKNPGKAHGLVLMMIAAELIHLRFQSSYSPTPGQGVSMSKVEFVLSKETVCDDDGERYDTLSICIDSNWDAFQLQSL